MLEIKDEVKAFNMAVGKLPSLVGIHHLRKQAELVFEEAQEVLDAAINEDILEILDGVCDVEYTNSYLKVLLEQMGVDVEGAMQAVVENNKIKIQLSSQQAKELKEYWDAAGVPCYISQTGVAKYVVQREADDKVMKALDHPRVDLTKFLPQDKLKGV